MMVNTYFSHHETKLDDVLDYSRRNSFGGSLTGETTFSGHKSFGSSLLQDEMFSLDQILNEIRHEEDLDTDEEHLRGFT